MTRSNQKQRRARVVELEAKAALYGECIGLMRQHLARVGIEAAFADDVAMLAARRIKRQQRVIEAYRALEVARLHGPEAEDSARAEVVESEAVLRGERDKSLAEVLGA